MDSILKMCVAITLNTTLNAITQCMKVLTVQDLILEYIKATNISYLSSPSSEDREFM